VKRRGPLERLKKQTTREKSFSNLLNPQKSITLHAGNGVFLLKTAFADGACNFNRPQYCGLKTFLCR